MDEIVKQALAKWPNVPHCHGWLGLDARGNWYLRDVGAQSLGGFASGRPGARGALLRHDKLIEFIHRNYAADEAGQWFFQNGPQRVYVELELTPWVWRLAADGSVRAHSGAAARVQRCVLDEQGRVYLETDLGFGLVHTQDVGLAAEAVEQGLWVPQEMPAASLPERFGYVCSPQARRAEAVATS
ncbi:DUF2946 family protein [Ramlibacter sp. 2FC]|uniref:DUF2946 family protein n=1 Tax=Ramlibacter sp. 2FC TaxID=2502188 RepID=UPI0010F810B6|nr:DUF2946 family protein [Ramlibacter sp. 2FC]